MVLLDVQGLSAYVGDKTLFNDLSFSIHEGDCIGFIGNNGIGKSTFVKQLAGIDTPSSLKRTCSKNLQLEYLPQQPIIYPELSILKQVFTGTSPLFQILHEYDDALQAVHHHPNEINTMRLFKATDAMDQHHAWQLESNARRLLFALGIQNIHQPISTLSGGLQKRVALAGTLLRPANLLLLDEPTNHLDEATITWLETELSTRQGALLLITHDRYFLDRICNKIIELDNGQLYTYNGNYADYLVQKCHREEVSRRREERQQKLYKNELAWMRKNVEARRTKQKARMDRFEKLSNEIVHTVDQKLNMVFQQARLGKKIIELHSLAYALEDKVLFENVNLVCNRYDRIGIVGRNGAGKTTLLNLIDKQISPSKGYVDIGDTVRIGYYRQDNESLPDEETPYQYIKSLGQSFTLHDGSQLSVGQTLEVFLFNPRQQQTPIKFLSGGEKRRLYLLSILMRPVNVLLLDEPTNDLDINTLLVLESFIESFPGPVIIISHDRYFLDRVCNRILGLLTNGQTFLITGNFTDYLNKKPDDIKDTSRQMIKKPDLSRCKIKPILKLTWQEEQDYAIILDQIESNENRISMIEKEMLANSNDYILLQEKQQSLEKEQQNLEKLLDRWAYLEDKINKINAEKEATNGQT